MARVTIEDCVIKVDDRFELVALAAQRAKDIASGSPITIERKGEKDTVISLREIAEDTIKVSQLRDDLVKFYQKRREMEEVVPHLAPVSSMPQELLFSEDEAAAGMDINDSEAEPGEEPAMEEEVEEFAAELLADAELDAESDAEEGIRVKQDAEKALEGMSFEEDNLDVDD